MHADDEDAPGRRRAGALESEILRLLVAASGPLTPRDVLGRLPARLSYSTVVTVLTRMYEKGLLARFKDGRSFRYAVSMIRLAAVPLTVISIGSAGR